MRKGRLPAFCPVCAGAIGWEELVEEGADGVERKLGHAAYCDGCELYMEAPDIVPVYDEEVEDAGQEELWA